eukprot:1219117-Alexandrium_andersonii.AAC.1
MHASGKGTGLRPEVHSTRCERNRCPPPLAHGGAFERREQLLTPAIELIVLIDAPRFLRMPRHCLIVSPRFLWMPGQWRLRQGHPSEEKGGRAGAPGGSSCGVDCAAPPS